MECYECAICFNQMPYFTPQEMEAWSFVGESGEEVLRRNFDGNVDNDPDLTGKENIEITPLSDFGPPVFVDNEHVFHQACARKWCKEQGVAVGQQVYTKIFSFFVPCIAQSTEFKHTCPTCRVDVLTSKFTVNTALVYNPLDEKTYPNEMPKPDGFNGKYALEDEKPRKSMMEIAFLITVLLITIIVIFVADFFGCSFAIENSNESISIRAAGVFGVNYGDFKGFQMIGEAFLHSYQDGEIPDDIIPEELRV